MLNVVCMNFRALYDDCYVNRLYSMTKRHLSLPFRFICIADRPSSLLHAEIEQLHCDDIGEGRGSRNKLRLFDGNWLPFESMLYLDITTVIKGQLDDLVSSVHDHDFVAIRDWYYESFNSSVMWIRRSSRTQAVWDTYASGKRFDQSTEGGDQDFIYHVFRENEWLDNQVYFPSDAIVSFRRLLSTHRTNRKKAYKMVQAAKIIKFHGHPKPHELLDPWIRFRYLIIRRPFFYFTDWHFLVEETREWWQ